MWVNGFPILLSLHDGNVYIGKLLLMHSIHWLSVSHSTLKKRKKKKEKKNNYDYKR